MHPCTYSRLADLVLITHVTFVAFVVIGLVVIICGGFAGWRWIKNAWFRAAHLASIGLVVVQAWLGIICPLTTLEMYLRGKSGDSTYPGTFIGHWLQQLLYYDAPPWVFIVCYTLFGLAAVGSWLKFRPFPFTALKNEPKSESSTSPWREARPRSDKPGTGGEASP